MPIFEYQCRTCDQVFEVLTRSVSGAQVVKCPQCGKTDVERLLSGFTGRTGSGSGCASTASGFG